jgi:hypothetical protein
MKTTVLTMVLALAAGVAMAQTAKPDAPVNKAAATKAANSKAATTKAAAKPPAKPAAAKKVAAKPAAKTLNVAALASHSASSEAVLGAAELSIAERVHVGKLPCELGNTVELTPDAQRPGYFDLQMAKTRYRLVPVPTTTGAIRLEDAQSGAVWLQLANKSMLMNHKLGQRMADECMSPQQITMAEQFKIQPPPSVLDAVPQPAAAAVATQPTAPR